MVGKLERGRQTWTRGRGFVHAVASRGGVCDDGGGQTPVPASAPRAVGAFASLATVLVAMVLAFGSLAGCSELDEVLESSWQYDTAERSALLAPEDVPEYSGDFCVKVNGGVPDFTAYELALPAGTEIYGRLDAKGRVTDTISCVGFETMPTKPRGDISDIHPTGWKQAFYDFTDEEYLMTRAHALAFSLTGEDANVQNLFTGTHCMNANVMEPFERGIAEYVYETGDHVIYAVDPVFAGNDLMAFGVHMKAYSLEDDGAGVSFNVFCYNVEPGVTIDYATGESCATPGGGTQGLPGDPEFRFPGLVMAPGALKVKAGATGVAGAAGTAVRSSAASTDAGDEDGPYVLNTGRQKFHVASCPSVEDIMPENKQTYDGSREELIALGYEPCGRCNP